jgi:YidC/Oxa1 family membrane protein insertase
VFLRAIATVTPVPASQNPSADINSPNLTPASESSELLSTVDPTVWENLSSIYLPDVVGAVAEHLHKWPSVQLMEQLVHSIHDSVGLPWWGTIVVTTFLLRASVLPIQIAFMKHQLRVKKLQPQLAQLDAQLKAAATPEEARSHANEILQVLQFYKARPLVQWWTPILFPPYFLSWFACVHNQALGNPDLLTGGLLWFVDLTVADPTFLLPVMASLSWLGIVEMGASALYLTSPRLKMWTRFSALAVNPVMSTLPYAVFCFWIPSNLWEIGRIMLFNTETVRATFRIPLRSELPPVQPISW